MKSLIFLFSLSFSLQLVAQKEDGLTLEYNMFDNLITYKRDGFVVREPKVKEGENIYISITEFNPYIMKAKVVVNNSDYNQVSAGLTNSGYGMSEGGSLSGVTSMIGGLSMGSSMTQSFTGFPMSRGAVDLQVAKARIEFSQLTSQLSAIESKINQSSKKIEMFKNIDVSRELAISDIEQLKENEHMRPSRIKDLMEEEINYAFAKSKGEGIDIDDIVNEMKAEDDFNATVEQYNNARDEYQKLAQSWRNFSQSVSLISDVNDDPQFDFIRLASDSISGVMQKNIANKLSKSINPQYSDKYFKENSKRMSILRQAYEELQSNIFTYQFPPVQASGDEVVIEIGISKKNEINTYESYKNLTQRVPVSGGWRITGGLGLTFGVLKNKSYDYSVVNSKIVSDSKDDFIPSIASFAHAYRRTTKNINVGGSFGVGFPLTGSQSASFFLGPTLIMGKAQKFLITTGLMGTKVGRLSNGFKVGDTYDSFSNTLPITNRYELGYFIAISYDLLR